MPSLSDAYARLDRAQEHLREVHALAQAICRAQAEATQVQVSPGKTLKPGEYAHAFSVKSANTRIEGRLAVLVGDAVNSMRSSLDYLIGELAELDSGNRQQRTQFPVEQSPDAFRNRRQTFLAGLSDAHVAHIESLQPYNGVSWTTNLARMSNWDKHNKLVLVAHNYLLGVTLKEGEPTADGELPVQMQFTLTPSLRVQLEDGLELLETLDAIIKGIVSTLERYATEFTAK